MVARDETVRVGDHNVALRSVECRDARVPSIILVHGAGGNEHAFDELFAHAGGSHVVALALPGRSGSAGPPLESVNAMATWLRNVVRALDLGAVVLVGHSLGGAIAIECALDDAAERQPWISTLVLMSTGGRLRVHPAILAASETAARDGTPMGLAEGCFARGSSPAVRARLDESHRTTPAATTLLDWRAANAFDRMSRLEEIHAPTRVWVGDEDVLTPPKYARYLAEQIPRAQLTTFAGAGHMLPNECAAAVMSALREIATGSAG